MANKHMSRVHKWHGISFRVMIPKSNVKNNFYSYRGARMTTSIDYTGFKKHYIVFMSLEYHVTVDDQKMTPFWKKVCLGRWERLQGNQPIPRSTRIPGGSAIFYVKISDGRKSKCLYLLIEMKFWLTFFSKGGEIYLRFLMISEKYFWGP